MTDSRYLTKDERDTLFDLVLRRVRPTVEWPAWEIKFIQDIHKGNLRIPYSDPCGREMGIYQMVGAVKDSGDHRTADMAHEVHRILGDETLLTENAFRAVLQKLNTIKKEYDKTGNIYIGRAWMKLIDEFKVSLHRFKTKKIEEIVTIENLI